MSPVFAHGQLRLYLLALLVEGPRHGYEIMQQLESRFGGLYTPSAGTIYPRLAKLEEEGLVVRTDDGRKATYAITDAGRAEVASRAGEIEDLQAGLDQSVRELADQVRASVHGQAQDLRAELEAAARAARSQARPAPRPDGPGHAGGPSGPGGPRPPHAPSMAQEPDDPRDVDPDAPWPGSPGWPGDSGPGGEHPGQHGHPGPGGPDGPHSWYAGPGWSGAWSGATDWVDLDLAVGDLRRQARDAWRRRGLTAEQSREIIEIVSEASKRIADVLRRPR